jgi:hypothetical protein
MVGDDMLCLSRGAEERGVSQTGRENGLKKYEEKQCHKQKTYEEKCQEKGKNRAKINWACEW